MKLKFLGTRGDVEEKSKTHKNRSSLLLISPRSKVLIDFGDEYGPEFLEQIQPDAIIITHWHPDHAFGLKKLTNVSFPIYVSDASLKSEYYKEEDFKNIRKNFRVYKREDFFKVANLNVKTVPILHSTKAPNIALFISGERGRHMICYASDVVSIPKEARERFLSKCDVYIGDLSTHRKQGLIRIAKGTKIPVGHASPHTQLGWADEAGVPTVIFTHLGSEPIKMGDEKLKKLLSKIPTNAKVIIAKDGDEFDLDELSGGTITTKEIEPITPKRIVKLTPKTALYLVPPHAKMIFDRDKTLIIKSKKFTSHINEPLYLIEDSLCYGIISLKEPVKITPKEFETLRPKHRITDKEAFEHWGWKKEGPLFKYEFQILEEFSPPRPVKVPKGVQVFVSADLLKWKTGLSLMELIAFETEDPEVFLEIKEELSSRGIPYRLELLIKESGKDWVSEYIKRLKKYTRAQVGDDWRIVLGWYSSLKRGKKLYKGEEKIEITEDDCKKIGLAIVKELIKRGCTFNAPSTYKKHARELFEWIIKKLGGVDKIPWKEGQRPKELAKEKQKLDPAKITREQLEFIDDQYCKSLSDEELKTLNKRLHKLYEEIGKVIEPLENAEIFCWKEMKKRGIPQTIWDPLTEAAALEVVEYPEPTYGKPQKILSQLENKTLQEVVDTFPDKIEVNYPYHVYLVGGLVNREKDLEGHDIDLLFKQPYPFISPTLKSILYQIAKRDPKLAKKIHFVWDPQGPQIGYTVPLYKLCFVKVPKEHMKRSSPFIWLAATPKLFTPCVGMKPRSGLHKNEFFDVKEMWEKWGTKWIDHGIVIQKKYDGMRFQIHVKGNKVAAYTEDMKRDRSKIFKKSFQELLKKKTADSFILDAEMVEYDCHGKEVKNNLENICDKLEREDMIKWIGATKKGLDDENVVFHVHDCILINDKPINNKGYLERWEAIRKAFPDKLKHWHRVDSVVVHNMKEFFNAVDKMRSLPGSEGVVCKVADSPYRIKFKGENRPDYWCKLKNLKEIDVMVYKVIQKKTKEGKPLNQYLYVSAFRIPCNMFEKFKTGKAFKKDGKCYAIIGRTYATGEKCKLGDIITVRPIKIDHFEDPKTHKIWYVWMFPLYAGKHPAKKEPDSLDVVKKIEAAGTGPTQKERVTMSKLIFKLEPCPFWNDENICPFKLRFFIPRDEKEEKESLSQEKLQEIDIEYLKFPIVCPFANLYRCRFVKPYYYGIKKLKVKEIDEDTGEENEDNS